MSRLLAEYNVEEGAYGDEISDRSARAFGPEIYELAVQAPLNVCLDYSQMKDHHS